MTEQQGQAPTAADTSTTTPAGDGTVASTDTTTTAHQVDVTASEAVPEQKAAVTPESVPADKPAAPEPKPAEKPADGDELESLSPADLAKMVRDLRKENASDRTAAKTKAAQDAQDDLVQRLGRAMGLIKDNSEAKPPTAGELTAQLTAAQKAAADRDAELRALRVETAAAKAARAHGADVDALLDSRSFADKLGELNPSDGGFPAALDALVKTTVKDNPKYKAMGPAPAASSGDFSGGSGDKPPTRNDIDDFRKARRARSGLA
ncbi:hypothetical protein ACIRPH_31125 [Nocardiopsis sp. NPDC101807]|uniref:hypothetical protein n=1 Tax=Nocardiopsis sp. NPDC101807 TaxID=3364339 RepID=UPI003817C2C1